MGFLVCFAVGSWFGWFLVFVSLGLDWCVEFRFLGMVGFSFVDLIAGDDWSDGFLLVTCSVEACWLGCGFGFVSLGIVLLPVGCWFLFVVYEVVCWVSLCG